MVERIYTRVNTAALQQIDPERAHQLGKAALIAAWRTPGGRQGLAMLAPPPDDRLRLRVWDLPFANPLGVAAGFDKNGTVVEPLIALGFGHVEVGTVTVRPQEGNPKPRLWRVPECNALINALGFPNDGAAAVRNRLASLRPQGVVGVNIGKNRDTPAEDAPEDYAALVRAVFDVANYITVNVSSPNTPGLRALQMSDELRAILTAVHQANEEMASIRGRRPRPVLVKIAPDLTDAEVEAIAGAAMSAAADGIIATNTTTSRRGIPEKYADLPGGLSGPPLRERANEVTRILYSVVGKRLPIIGVGGISSGADAIERIRSGATLVQIYTAFVYGGPTLPARILKEMSEIADREGWQSVTEIVGAGT